MLIFYFLRTWMGKNAQSNTKHAFFAFVVVDVVGVSDCSRGYCSFKRYAIFLRTGFEHEQLSTVNVLNKDIFVYISWRSLYFYSSPPPPSPFFSFDLFYTPIVVGFVCCMCADRFFLWCSFQYHCVPSSVWLGNARGTVSFPSFARTLELDIVMAVSDGIPDFSAIFPVLGGELQGGWGCRL